MKKERQPLTKREKVLLGLGIVGVGVAGYFGYKYFGSLKINNREINTDATEELQKTKEDLAFMKFLIVEGNIVPHALQNGKNKLERVKNKMVRLEKHIADRGAQPESVKELEMLKNDENFLINCLAKAGMVQEMIDNDSLDYAK